MQNSIDRKELSPHSGKKLISGGFGASGIPHADKL